MPLRPEWVITAEELQAELTEGVSQVKLLDVRDAEEYQEVHIDSCHWIPLPELETRASAELSIDQNIVIYCAHGFRSLDATFILKQLGFTKVRSLEGGIEAWQTLQEKTNSAF